MGFFKSDEERKRIKAEKEAERMRINYAVEERMRRQEERERQEEEQKRQKYLAAHSDQLQAEHKRFIDSGQAIGEYTEEMMLSLIDAELENIYRSMPGAWTGLALTLTGDQSSNEIINTLKVMIRQNSVLIKQNELILRELRKLNEKS